VSVSRCFACGLLQRGRLGYVVAGRGAPARMAFVAYFCIHMFSSSSLQFANLVGLFSRPDFEWEPGRAGRRKRNQGTRGAKKAADRQVLLHTFKMESGLKYLGSNSNNTPRRPALIWTRLEERPSEASEALDWAWSDRSWRRCNL
jgi:hypothetical protein